MKLLKVRVNRVAIAICVIIIIAFGFSKFNPLSRNYKTNVESLRRNAKCFLIQVPFTIVQDGKSKPLGNKDIDVDDVIQETDEEVINVNIFEDETLEQNDPSIISYIRKRHLYPPKPREVAYNLTRNENPSQMTSTISKVFKGKRNGIFIEAGACNGEFFSNTLDLERNFNWTGLLVEANSFLWSELLEKNRKAWISDVGLSIIPRPQQLTILHHHNTKLLGNPNEWLIGHGIIEPSDQLPRINLNPFDHDEWVSAGKIECFPLFSILSAINMTKIDFFSFDVEGVELKVLKTIPFELVDIQVHQLKSTESDDDRTA